MVVEMGRVMYCVCLGISTASVHGYEDLAQGDGVYHVPCPMEMPLGILTVSLSPCKDHSFFPFALRLSSSLTNSCA